MLQQLVHIIICSVILIIWGLPLLLFFKATFSREKYWFNNLASFFSFLFFLGCIALGCISSWLSFFIPLDYTYLLIFTIVLSFYLLIFQKNNITKLIKSFNLINPQFTLIHKAALIVSLLLFIYLSSLQPVHGDTQIYHMQLIRWLSEFGIVPGIANLYPRLGLGSNWFNLISFFYYPHVTTENFTYLNAAMVSWFFVWLFSKWHFHYKNSININFKILSIYYFSLLLFSFFDWQLFRDSANSTNYDFIVTAFTIIVISYFFEALVNNDERKNFSMIVFVFSLSVISFKFSGIFIGALLFYHLLFTLSTVKWHYLIIFGFIILSPIFIRNYITTGYPIFPLPLSIYPPDWQFPKEMTEIFYNYILNSNKLYNTGYQFTINFSATAFNWIPYWFKGILWKHIIIFFLAISPVIFLFLHPKIISNRKRFIGFVLSLLFMICGWFFTAPDPGRFGYGVLLPSAFIFTSIIFYKFVPYKIFTLTLGLLIITITYYTYSKASILPNPYENLIRPISYIKPGYTIYIKDSMMKYHLPKIHDLNWDHRCYFTPLPCITQPNKYLEARGNTIKDGFRMNAYPDSIFIKNYEY